MTESVSNVSYTLGANKIESLVVEGVEAAVIAKGTPLSYNKLTGYYKVYSGGVETIEAICGIETTIPAAGYVETICSVAGLFNGAALVLPSGVTLDVVQKSSAASIAIAVKAGGNTGTGVAGAITQGNLAKAGTYNLSCTTATTPGSEIFSCFDPEGSRLADLTVGVAYNNGHFAVTIAAGGTGFALNDGFTVVPQVNATGTPRMLMTAKGMLTDDIVQMKS